MSRLSGKLVNEIGRRIVSYNLCKKKETKLFAYLHPFRKGVEFYRDPLDNSYDISSRRFAIKKSGNGGDAPHHRGDGSSKFRLILRRNEAGIIPRLVDTLGDALIVYELCTCFLRGEE